MIARFPTRTDAMNYELEIELDGIAYVFEFRWNERLSAWVFQIRDVLGTLLLAARRVVVNYPLLSRYRDPRLPLGELNAVDTSGVDTDPGPADLGDRVKLLYFSAADIPAAFKL